jgi:hypothetical protein
MPLLALLQLVALSAAPFSSCYLAPPDGDSELIRRYLNAVQNLSLSRRSEDTEVTIEARLLKLNRQATLRATRSISRTGKVTYVTLASWGDGMVKREVIARYLAAESLASELDEIAITPSQYKFRFIRAVGQANRRIEVFQLSPKRRRLGLFKGELWLDSQTGLPVHESGQFVKNPSIFVKRIVFVRDYQIRDGIAIPTQITSTVDTRLVGRAELSIQFSSVRSHEIQNREEEEYLTCQ